VTKTTIENYQGGSGDAVPAFPSRITLGRGESGFSLTHE
jgi:hypothetical protein